MQAGPTKQRLLLVDGDPKSLRVLDVTLKKAGFQVATASNGVEALAAIEAAAPDLVISDTHMPEMDGFELCRRIKQRPEWTKIPFIFLSSRKAIEDKIRGLELGVEDYLTKPIYIKEITTRVKMLLQRQQRERLESRRDGRTKFAGRLSDISVVDLVQTIDVNRKSGIVHIVGRDRRRGDIYFREGKIVDAEVGRLSGTEAIFRLFSWAEGDFEVEFKSIRRKDVIELSSQALLMEGMRRLDEWTHLLETLPPLETVFEVDYHLLAERLAEIPDEVNGILRLFDGRRTFQQVVEDCDFPDLEAAHIIAKLVEDRIIYEARRETSEPAEPTRLEPSPRLERWLSEEDDQSSGEDAFAEEVPTVTEGWPRAGARTMNQTLPGTTERGTGTPAPARRTAGASPPGRMPARTPAPVLPARDPASGSGAAPLAATSPATPGALRSPVSAGVAAAELPSRGDVGGAASAPRTDYEQGYEDDEDEDAASPPGAPAEAIGSTRPATGQTFADFGVAKAPEETTLVGLDPFGHKRRRRSLAIMAAVGCIVVAVFGFMKTSAREAPPLAPAPPSPAVASAEPPAPGALTGPGSNPVSAPAAGAAPAAANPPTTGAPAPSDPSPAAPPAAPGGLPAVNLPAGHPGGAGSSGAPAAPGPGPTNPALEEARAACRKAHDGHAYQDVLALCPKALAMKPDMPDILLILANAELENGQLTPAKRWAKKALAVDPNVPEAHVFVGFAEQAAGRNAAARAAYLRYLELAPNGKHAEELKAVLERLR
jgi:CheY-like chemotaxis protein